jgi:signal transduction histidine kinase
MPANQSIIAVRKVLTIKMPVTTTDVNEFRSTYIPLGEKISRFITAELPNFGVHEYIDPDTVHSIVKNSFDSRIKLGLTVGEELILKIVIQKKEGKVLVKIKDNGTGFLEHEKGVVFKADAIKREDKQSEGAHEETVSGLTYIHRGITAAGGSYFFKNRKQVGASVYMQFQAKNKNSSASTATVSQVHEEEQHTQNKCCRIC